MALAAPVSRSQELTDSAGYIAGNVTRHDGEDDDDEREDVSKIIERLDDVISLGDPDRDIPSSLEDSDSIQSNPEDSSSLCTDSGKDKDDSPSLGADSVNGTHDEKADKEEYTNKNNNSTMPKSSPPKIESKADIPATNANERKKSDNPVKGLFKRLTKSSSGTKLTPSPKDAPKSTGKVNQEDFSTIKIDKLPQYFVVKYLGKRSCEGLWGVKHVRKPVDEMVNSVTKQLSKSAKPLALPLSYMIVSHKGLDMREHPNNKVKNFPQLGLVPIDFISYGVQDIKYWRVFTFIVVQEMSSRSKKMECHAVICDSSISARKIALSLAAAFQVNMRKLKVEGREHRFQVELRPPDELADKYQTVQDEEEC